MCILLQVSVITFWKLQKGYNAYVRDKLLNVNLSINSKCRKYLALKTNAKFSRIKLLRHM